MADVTITNLRVAPVVGVRVPTSVRAYPITSFLLNDASHTAVTASSPHTNGSYYKTVALTANGAGYTAPSFTLPSTTDSPDNPNGARWGLFVFDGAASPRMMYEVAGLGSFALDHTDLSQDADEIIAYNLGGLPVLTTGDRTVSGDLHVEGGLQVDGSITSDDTLAVNDDVNVAGIVTANAFVGSGVGLTGIGTGTGGVLNTGSTTVGADTDDDGVGVIDFQTRNITRARVKNNGEFELFGPALLKDYAIGSVPAAGLVRSGDHVYHNGKALGNTFGINVSHFATGGAGTLASPWTGWDTAITWAAESAYFFPPHADGSKAYYAFATCPNWGALKGIQLRGSGSTSVLKHTGTGNAVSFIGTSVAVGTFKIVFEDLEILGNAATTRGLYLEAIHHAKIRNITVREVTTAAFEFHFTILSTYDNLTYSHNSDAAFIPPVNGIVTNIRNAGETVQACTFINPIIEGTTEDGIVLSNAWQNQFIGGSSEGNGGTGVTINSTSKTNTFFGMDFEANIGNDITDNGEQSLFIKVLSAGTANFTASSKFPKIDGGLFNSITALGASSSPLIVDGWPAYNLSATGALNFGTNNASVNMVTPFYDYLNPAALGGPGYSAPTFANSWVNFGGSASSVLWRKNGARVCWQGAMKNGTVGAGVAAFTIPANFRPFGDRVWTIGGNVIIIYGSTGVLSVDSGGNTRVDLDGIAYDAAQ